MGDKTFSRISLIECGKLDQSDILQINQCRGKHNKLGFAYQLIFVKLLNQFPQLTPFEIIEEIATYASVQLAVDLDSINLYKENRKTIAAHQQEIMCCLGLKQFNDRKQLENFVFNEALRLEAPSLLKNVAIQFLKEHKILSPTTDTLNRLIAEQRNNARKYIFDTVQSKLSASIVEKLNNLLTVQTEYSGLEMLKRAPPIPSAKAILNLIQRLNIIKETEVLSIDLSNINNNYQKVFTREVRSYSISRLKELETTYRHTALICFLHQVHQDTTDFLVDTFMKLLNTTNNRVETKLEDKIQHKEKKIKKALTHYGELQTVIKDKGVANIDLRPKLYEKFGNELQKLEEDKLDVLLEGKSDQVFKLLVNKYSYLRQFAPEFIEALNLQLDEGSKSDIIQAIEMLREINQNNQRTLPRDIPTKFISRQLRKYIISGPRVDRHGWECALLFKIREEIDSSNISVKHSKRFGEFKDFFISQNKWDEERTEFFSRRKLPQDPQKAVEYWTQRLSSVYDQYIACEKKNKYAKVVDGKWALSSDPAIKLTTEQKKGLKELQNWLALHMRNIKLPDLLVEVDNELHFTEAFMLPSNLGLRLVEDICNIIATIMAHGCNIGLYTMSRLIQEVTYDQMVTITDWQITDEALRTSLAEIVNEISKLPVTKSWGEGKTSSSDTHIVAFHQKVLQQGYNVRFKDFALKFYTFIADNYAPFHSKPIECNEGEAPHALDGSLYNESDLELEEHYTDTGAAATLMFTAFAFAGPQYNPRIRGIQKHRIFKIDKDRSYGSLEPLLKHRESIIKMDVICEQWDKMAQFYASISNGHTTASVALKRLLAMKGKNKFYEANVQLGRILKTENTLLNMIDSEKRRKRHRGLLKGEEMHQLAREINYGNRGIIKARDLPAQSNCCSCLTLIMACVIYWQSKEIMRVLSEYDIPSDLDLSLLEHISPVGWDNIVLYGEYIINKKLIRR